MDLTKSKKHCEKWEELNKTTVLGKGEKVSVSAKETCLRNANLTDQSIKDVIAELGKIETQVKGVSQDKIFQMLCIVIGKLNVIPPNNKTRHCNLIKKTIQNLKKIRSVGIGRHFYCEEKKILVDVRSVYDLTVIYLEELLRLRQKYLGKKITNPHKRNAEEWILYHLAFEGGQDMKRGLSHLHDLYDKVVFKDGKFQKMTFKNFYKTKSKLFV